MTKSSLLAVSAGVILTFASFAALASALPTRTWVSGKGSDSGSCSLASPCRTFAYAIAQTAAGGEIDVLDPAGYGALTITQSISIVNDGVGEAGVQAGSGGAAITINAGASDVIQLRGLTIEGAKISNTGIQYNSGASLTVVNCVVRNFTDNGVDIAPTNGAMFFLKDLLVSDNGAIGILVQPQDPGAVKGVMDHVKAINNPTGVKVDGADTASSPVNVTIVNSSIATNTSNSFASTGAGLLVSAASAGQTSVNVRNTSSDDSAYAFQTSGPAILRLANSEASGNYAGIVVDQASTVYSYLDNDVTGNTTNVSGSLSTGTKQ